MLADLNIDPGLSLDITTCDELRQPWNFNKHSMRVRAKRRLADQAPERCVGSPMCTDFSTSQRINRLRNPKLDKIKLRKARRHLEYANCTPCRQSKDGDSSMSTRTNASWVKQMPRGQGIRKPTRWMSNSEDVLAEFDKRCYGKGGSCLPTGKPHAQCSGKTVREAAIYLF